MCFVPPRPAVNIDNRYPRVSVRPVSPDTPYSGFYAETIMPDGWLVQHYGESAVHAEANLRRYINNGQYEQDRNR